MDESTDNPINDPYAHPVLQPPMRSGNGAGHAPTQIILVMAFFFFVFFLYTTTAFVSILVAQLLVNGTVADIDEASMAQLMQSRLGFFLLLVPGQLAILIPSLLVAALSPLGMTRRLGVVRGHWPWWAWVCGVLATPLIGLLSSLALSPWAESSEHLSQLTDTFRFHANGGFLVATLLMVAALPGVCEEALFGGCIQTWLAIRFPAVVAVGIASILFALFHLDPIHVIAVLPIGIWLGFLRHASGSIFPAVLAHAANNLLSVISVMPADTDALDAPGAVLTMAVIGIGLPACIVTVYVASAATWRADTTN